MPAIATPPSKPISAPAASPAPAPAKPATPPSTPPPPRPSSQPAPRPSVNLDSIDSDLDSLSAPPEKPAQSAPAKKPDEPTPTSATKSEASADEEFETLMEDLGEKPVALPDSKKEPAHPQSASELRKAYEEVKKKSEESESTLSQLRAELDTLKKSVPKDDPERKALVEQLNSEKTRRSELDDEMRYLNYERSGEYRERYEKPLMEAFQSAYEVVKELPVNTEEGSRAGTDEDFNRIVRLGTNDAIKVSKEMFGDAAWEVMDRRRKVLELNRTRQGAVQDFRSKGAEREKQMLATRASESERFGKLWQENISTLTEKYPDYFKPSESDPKGNELLDAGTKLADLGFIGYDTLTPEQAVRVHATIRNRAAAFPRMAHRLNESKARIADLELELAAFQKSQPRGDSGRSSGASAPEDNWESSLEKLASTPN